MTQLQVRFALVCVLSGAVVCGVALAKRPKAAVDAVAEAASICVASDDASDEACAVNLPPDKSQDDASDSAMDAVSAVSPAERSHDSMDASRAARVPDDSGDAIAPKSIKELRQALRELNKLGDDSMAACDSGQFLIEGEIDRQRNLIITEADIATVRADDDDASDQIILKLCPASTRDLQRARKVDIFRFSGQDMPFVAGEPNIINAKGEIRIDRPTHKHAEIEAELLQRTCVAQCP